MNKRDALDQIKADILAKNICPDLAKTATQLVFGDGNPDSEIVFVGEAPGKNEDLQGKPFVGAAGKFLDVMLDSIGLSRPDIYITNIVKYRPPDNRDPLPEEKIEFLPYLKAQLEVIQPKIVVTLGRHSMNCFLPDLQITKVHGNPHRINIRSSDFEILHHKAVENVSERPYGNGTDVVQGEAEKQTESYEHTMKGASQASTQQRTVNDGGIASSASEQATMSVVVLPLYHPAAALYNGGLRQTLMDDFAKLPIILEKIRIHNHID